MDTRLAQLFALRKAEIDSGKKDEDTPVRKILSDLKIITTQFHLIQSVIEEEIKTLYKIFED